MQLHSMQIQRELTWLLDALYKFSPEEFRPDGASATVHPKISVLKIDQGYAVTFVWDGADTEFIIPTDKALEMLRRRSRFLIDMTLQAKYKGKPYIRRPLLTELKKDVKFEGVLVSSLGEGKIKCQPMRHFPWHSEHEFSCANDRDVDDARRFNRMIIEGIAVASPL